MRFSVSDMCQTALLAAFIAVSGSFKIPSLIPGSEFQLSAPVAVAACGIFGIKKYLTAGIARHANCFLCADCAFFPRCNCRYVCIYGHQQSLLHNRRACCQRFKPPCAGVFCR